MQETYEDSGTALLAHPLEDKESDAFLSDLSVQCPGIAQALLKPDLSEYDCIDSFAPVRLGSERLMIDWRDQNLPARLRAAAFGSAQHSALISKALG